ncbi:hypothetical protein CBW46_013065 [Paenibacillus xerothermodurans]|uniref:Uncharacterized protein n=1 Tax=Paenibacillus xerothermodurans TaxID=1977292 RepID=A0A2W1N7I0_PAEXE|nr:hypothetical protein CBW46_013065 [Paenibacillus xerothermodurans]
MDTPPKFAVFYILTHNEATMKQLYCRKPVTLSKNSRHTHILLPWGLCNSGVGVFAAHGYNVRSVAVVQLAAHRSLHDIGSVRWAVDWGGRLVRSHGDAPVCWRWAWRAAIGWAAGQRVWYNNDKIIFWSDQL